MKSNPLDVMTETYLRIREGEVSNGGRQKGQSEGGRVELCPPKIHFFGN